MEEHILLTFATSKYDSSEYAERQILSEVLASIVDLFTNKLKVYKRQLGHIGENPSESDLENKLDE